MKALAYVMAVMLWCSGPVVAADRPMVKVVFLAFPGYSELDESGEVVGPGVEVVRRLFAEANYPIEVGMLPAARIWRGLEDGSIHVWPGIANKPGLGQHTLRTERNIGRVSVQLYYLPGAPPPRWPDDLRNKSVITITNFTYNSALQELLADPQRNLVIHKSASHAGAVQMLLLGRGDYLLDYRSPVASALRALNLRDLPSVPVTELPMHFLLSRHSGFAEQLRLDLDAAYDRLLERGVDVGAPLL